MGFKSRYQDLTCYFETVPIGRSSTRRYLQSTREAQRWIWRPTIPSWEKEFCRKIGSFTWENFLNYKKCIYHFEKVLNWNDLAAEEAFQHAKNRFYAEFHNFSFVETFKPDPNLYIDEIDWNSEIDAKLHEELELSLVQEEEGEEDENLTQSYLRRTYDIPIEETSPTGVWTSTIPAWEKEFCLKIGSFTWDNFLNCKNYTYHFEKIPNWNDLAADEAFRHAKNRFYVEFHNFPFVETFKLDPNLYIDWNSEIDPELLEELELALIQEEQGQGDENLFPSYLRRTYDIPIDEIIPTGWDDDSFDKWNVLTGLIVGDHSSCGEGAQVSRS